ncbi:hypothetical protein [Thermoanaerobacter sp. RKWS2]|jgi:transposase-like protein|uniref:hypothetical protein n=1 Tax=Thermoanaerobacter sp. RKWS2 TaxID=2983842 RepID=UPI0017521D34|nr:hypothetical protein [Thermoanaerobacter sp. RKWS2]UZQ81741.1 hypothetical protein OEI98_001475 [Thermoanaerobacter sp. RKWS2]HHY79730.1 hypothetical protein [Thermoanaerobacter sp.]
MQTIRCPSCGSKNTKIIQVSGQPVFYCNSCQISLTSKELYLQFKKTKIRSKLESKVYYALQRAAVRN